VPEEFANARPTTQESQTGGPVKRPPRRNPTTGVKRPPRYRRKSPAPKVIPQPAAELVDIGVTIWRLRPSLPRDDGARILVMESAQTTHLTPERVEHDTVLRVGDRVRITVESPRAGYLYIIDRELNADGSLGEPYLIFPTTRTRAGDNRVLPGKLIDIPGQEDMPSYFTLIPTPERNDQVGEMLTIIVTPTPLAGLAIGSQPARIPASDVQQWERTYGSGGEVEVFEMEGGAGLTWTTAEQSASAVGSARLLTQEEPAPQTIFRVSAKTARSILVTVPLRYRR
jgi:hypothetical protein